MKILLLTGAGLSFPLGLPMTTGFNSLVNDINADLRFFLSGYLNKSNDIEKILSVLELFTKDDSLTEYIIKDKYASGDGNYRIVVGEINRLKVLANESIRRIKGELFTILENYEESKAHELYKYLLEELKGVSKENSISIFSTNYDLTFESFIYSRGDVLDSINIKDVKFSFQLKRGKHIFDHEFKFGWEPNMIEYQKLHGSLDWIKNNTGQVMKSGATYKPAIPDEMPILYPGYKDIPTAEPFITIHNSFFDRLRTADLIIVIGFAFRDPYINSLFDAFLKSNEKKVNVLCFNPASIDELPTESRISSLMNAYSEFKHIKKGIEIKPSPLELTSHIR